MITFYCIAILTAVILFLCIVIAKLIIERDELKLGYKTYKDLYTETEDAHDIVHKELVLVKRDKGAEIARLKEVIKFVGEQNTILMYKLNELSPKSIVLSDIIDRYNTKEVNEAFEQYLHVLQNSKKK